MFRKYTNAVLDAVEEGVLDKDQVILACLKYMSEDDVEDMVRCNEFLPCLEEDEEDFDQDPSFEEDA